MKHANLFGLVFRFGNTFSNSFFLGLIFSSYIYPKSQPSNETLQILNCDLEPRAEPKGGLNNSTLSFVSVDAHKTIPFD